jgi:hypothetical protein
MQKVRLGNKTLTEALYFIGRKSWQFDADCVVAIERGGLPLATFLSAYLNVPLERIKVSFYKDMEKQETPIVDLRNFDVSFYHCSTRKPIGFSRWDEWRATKRNFYKKRFCRINIF